MLNSATFKLWIVRGWGSTQSRHSVSTIFRLLLKTVDGATW